MAQHIPRRNNKWRRRKRFLILYIILLIATLFAMACLRTCNSPSVTKNNTPAKAQQSDTLRIAITYSPLSYYTYNDTLGGINYDLLRRMAKDLNRPAQFIPVVSTDKSLEALRNGQYDLFASLPVTAEMKKQYLFTDGIYTDNQVLIQRKNSDGSVTATSVLDLAGDTIHIEKNSAARERLENMAFEIGADIVITSHTDLSDEYLFLKVVNGDFRYAVINGKMAAKMIENHPEISADTKIGFTQFQAWLTRRQNAPLMQLVDNWLSDFKQTPEYAEILKRYITVNDSTSTNKQQ